MDFKLNREQQDIIKAAREFAQGEFPDVALDFDREEHFNLKIWKKACKLGFVGVFIEEKYDGAEYGFFEHCLVTEEFCAVDPGIGRAILSTTHGAEIISSFGSNDQKKQILPELISGKSILAVAVSEPDGDRNVMRAATTATKDGDMWVINGSKTSVLNGTLADRILVYSRIDPENPSSGERYGFFLVPTDTAGCEIRKMRGRLGLRASESAKISFDAARVPAENRVGNEAEGSAELGVHLNFIRLGICAQAVGLARSALREAIQYTRARHVFGAPLSTYQVTQFKIAEMATRIRAARNLYYEAVWGVDQGMADEALIGMAKRYCTEAALFCTDEALQMHGGYGYIDEYRVQRLYRDAKALELQKGTGEMELITRVINLGLT